MATCTDCRFSTETRIGILGQLRLCRRHPKRPDMGWPQVDPADWCGEHHPVTPEPAVAAVTALVAIVSALPPFLRLADAMSGLDGDIVISTDLADEEGELFLTSNDFLKLADAFVRATGG